VDALLSDLDPGTDGFADPGATSWLGDLSPRSDWSPLNSTSRLDQSELLNEQVHADELQELLARLAATDAFFNEAVPTIRDVAEATDASPLLIGRILSQMRGPDEVAELKGRMDGFEGRLRELESTRNSQSKPGIEIKDLLIKSGTASFEPLAHSKAVTSQNLKRSSTEEKSWSSTKELEEFVATWNKSQASPEQSAVFVTISGIILILILVGACRSLTLNSPNPGDRPIPFPIERSSR
jgi:hypothetical protein